MHLVRCSFPTSKPHARVSYTAHQLVSCSQEMEERERTLVTDLTPERQHDLPAHSPTSEIERIQPLLSLSDSTFCTSDPARVLDHNFRPILRESGIYTPPPRTPMLISTSASCKTYNTDGFGGQGKTRSVITRTRELKG